MPAAAAPTRIVSGKFDTDGQPDLVWDFASAAGPARRSMAYSPASRRQPLEVVVVGGQRRDGWLFSSAISAGDGIDDSVLLDGAAAVSRSYLSGMPAPSTVTADPPCSP